METKTEKAERLVWELYQITYAIRKTPLKYLLRHKQELNMIIGRLKRVVEWLP